MGDASCCEPAQQPSSPAGYIALLSTQDSTLSTITFLQIT